jgi:sterol desaturase/sphingolipid hydroxylase (fatty acid hydroxylase superfamily)
MFIDYRRGDVPLEDQKLESTSWILTQFSLFYLLSELQFYVSHRALHHRSIYRHFHSFHHVYSVPFAIAGVAAHPIEYIFNLLSVLIGPMVFACHPVTATAFIFIAVTNNVISHSGYDLPGVENRFHDFHHQNPKGCFGFGICDMIFGTSKEFYKVQEKLPKKPSLAHAIISRLRPSITG